MLRDKEEPSSINEEPDDHVKSSSMVNDDCERSGGMSAASYRYEKNNDGDMASGHRKRKMTSESRTYSTSSHREHSSSSKYSKY